MDYPTIELSSSSIRQDEKKQRTRPHFHFKFTISPTSDWQPDWLNYYPSVVISKKPKLHCFKANPPTEAYLTAIDHQLPDGGGA